MTPIVIINGIKQSKTSVFNRNIQFGDGLFETCVVKNKNVIFWPYHLKRLNKGCEKLGITKVKESLWLSDIKKALSISRLSNCIVKIILSRGESLSGYGYKDDIKAVRIVIVSKKTKTPNLENFTLGFCDTSYASNAKLAGIKHCNRLEQILARANLKHDEGIMLDENGNVISVTQGNIFSIYTNTLSTPSLDKCGIKGTRRDIVLEIANELEMQVNIGTISVEDLMKSDEIFITNSVIGIQSVTTIGEMSFATNFTTKSIKEAFAKRKQAEEALLAKRNKISSRLIKLAIVAALIFWLWTSKDMLGEDGKIYHLQKGTNIEVLAQDLQDKKLINSKLYFRIVSKITGASNKLQTGYYHIDSKTSVLDFLKKVSTGDIARQNIALIEGVTLQNYYNQLYQNPGVVVDKKLDEVMKSLNIKAPYEGWIFPDTYQVNYGDSIESIFVRAYGSMKEQLDILWGTRSENLPFNSPYEAIILASFIEKETARNEEKSKISGVLIRRLKAGMRLQTDPSVIYALGDAYTGSLSKNDLRIKSPYNTYRNEGLPPGAIGSVSYKSLHAAFHPDNSNNLYFVSKKDGTHAFAETYQEHKDNIERYLNN